NPGAILMTEFNNRWEAIGIDMGGSFLSKSHRPLNAFQHLSTGSDEYAPAPDTPGYNYGQAPHYGIIPYSSWVTRSNLIENPGESELNCVGRHHPGNDGFTGGSANFLYCDGHVEKKTVLQTIIDREWGTRLFGISGYNKIGRPWN